MGGLQGLGNRTECGIKSEDTDWRGGNSVDKNLQHCAFRTDSAPMKTSNGAAELRASGAAREMAQRVGRNAPLFAKDAVVARSHSTRADRVQRGTDFFRIMAGPKQMSSGGVLESNSVCAAGGQGALPTTLEKRAQRRPKRPERLRSPHWREAGPRKHAKRLVLINFRGTEILQRSKAPLARTSCTVLARRSAKPQATFQICQEMVGADTAAIRERKSSDLHKGVSSASSRFRATGRPLTSATTLDALPKRPAHDH